MTLGEKQEKTDNHSNSHLHPQAENAAEQPALHVLDSGKPESLVETFEEGRLPAVHRRSPARSSPERRQHGPLDHRSQPRSCSVLSLGPLLSVCPRQLRLLFTAFNS
ncbi:unnamed protein product [Pleuronectes platessa]|uniref:Uncharacterized protein n=1 Tax=Pleuronectes platessa TaxID=8262 RepID=A0A9N7YYK9_PLEPL|nr:unnamed protein product [Pleuronectes platessa]